MIGCFLSFNISIDLETVDMAPLPCLITSGRNRMSNRKTGALELAALAFLTWLFVWVMGPRIAVFNTIWVTFAFLLSLLYFTFISPVLIHADNRLHRGFGDWKTLFVRTDNFKPALKRFGLISGVGGAAIIFAAFFKNPRVFHEIAWKIVVLKFSLYLIFSTVQGLFILFVMMRIADILSCDPFQTGGARQGRKSRRHLITLLITSVFTLVHLPNLPLMGITMVITPLVLWQYYLTPNFFLLVCTHSILGTLLHQVYRLPMRIGPFYTHPDQYLIRELFPLIGRIIGNAW